MTKYRFIKVACELNRSIQDLINILEVNGFTVPTRDTGKITEEMYEVLLREFASDKEFKLENMRGEKPKPTSSKSNYSKVGYPKCDYTAKEESSDISSLKVVVQWPRRLGKIEKSDTPSSSDKLSNLKVEFLGNLGTPKGQKLAFPSIKSNASNSINVNDQNRYRNSEDEEFEELVAELMNKGFTMSAQVSNYIVQHKLGYKYKRISGVLDMENGCNTWKFNGGFPPRIYAKLCDRLNLGNKGTSSKVLKFTPFKDIKSSEY
jgi:hypothetical protein